VWQLQHKMNIAYVICGASFLYVISCHVYICQFRISK